MTTNELIKAVKYGSGISFAGVTARLSVVNGMAFVTQPSIDLRPFRGFKVTVAGATETAVGWIKDAGNGETFESSLWEPDASVLTSGTYGWIAQGSNTIENDSNELKITYGSNVAGARVYFSGASDLSSNLTSGALYRYSANGRINTGSCNVRLHDGSAYVLTVSPINQTSKTAITPIYFTSRSASAGYAEFSGLGAGEIVWADDFALERVLTPSLLGATIVSAQGGSTFNWASNSGLGTNAASFTFTITRS
jgi:hypothetical protein